MSIDNPTERASDIPDDAPWWIRWMVSNWRDAWKWAETWFVTLLGALPLLYDHMDLLQDFMEPKTLHSAMSGLAVLALIYNLKNRPAQPKESA